MEKRNGAFSKSAFSRSLHKMVYGSEARFLLEPPGKLFMILGSLPRYCRRGRVGPAVAGPLSVYHRCQIVRISEPSVEEVSAALRSQHQCLEGPVQAGTSPPGVSEGLPNGTELVSMAALSMPEVEVWHVWWMVCVCECVCRCVCVCIRVCECVCLCE